MASSLPGPKPPSQDAVLALEDGTIYRGRSVGAPGERACELVFNTAMTGYQEILTDPSYCGQGVVMTYPQIGNYGVSADDEESDRCWSEVFVMRQLAAQASSWRASGTLDDYLRENGVPAIDGIDTRHLTLRLRERGALRAVLATGEVDAQALVAKARAHPGLDGRDLAAVVSCKRAYEWNEPLAGTAAPKGERLPLVVYDFGVKRNILRCLVSAGFAPRVVPAATSAADALTHQPAGVFLSNGPGDPAAVTYAHAAVREIAASGTPVLGICLGHQILAHAFGGSTHKMKFGHHGANHPVIEIGTGRIDITSQNHSFAVDAASLEGTGLEVTHLNANDGVVEGMRHAELPVFSVQYHPEAAPGPHDARHLFQRFRALATATVPA
ncbi:MAG TPA: glutamine-hydrolyzing carbamoyl-phosphate synthase small subunit [Planctomycetota bacterium]